MATHDELNARYKAAREAIGAAEQALKDVHRDLRALLADTDFAEGKGRIRQQIWAIEKALGLHQGYFSQAGQDRFLETQIFRGKRGGAFAEIGGYDGITGSNTLFFEMMRGWVGVVVEPVARHHEKAAGFRRARCIRAAVAGAAGSRPFLDVTAGLTQMGGLDANLSDQSRKAIAQDPQSAAETIEVETRTLAQILDAAGLARLDYVSLDVEGAELEILESFPFERIAVTAWTVEAKGNAQPIARLMQEKGYRRLTVIGDDHVFVSAQAARAL